MCSMSMVMDYFNVRPGTPWAPDTFAEFKEIIRRLDALDSKLGEPECHDPAKAAWMQAVEKRLAELEGSTP